MLSEVEARTPPTPNPQPPSVRARHQRPRACLLTLAGRDAGQSAVELALVLPIILLLMTGIMTGGLAMNNYLTLYEATSVGARQLSITRGQGGDPCGIAASAIAAAAPLLQNNGPVTGLGYSFTVSSAPGTSVTYNSNPPSCGNALLVQGQNVTVTTTYPCILQSYGIANPPNCLLRATVTEVTQ